MGWSRINAVVDSTNFNGTTHTTPVTANISGLTLTAGDLLVVSMTWGNNDISSTASLTDNAGTPNTFYKHTSPVWNAPLAQGALKFWAPVVTTGATQLSLSWTGGTNIAFVGWIVEQFRHTAGALTGGNPVSGSPASQGQANPGTATDAVTSTTTTPAVIGTLVHGNVMFPNGFTPTLTVGTGFTLGTNDTGTTLQETEWLEDGATSAIAATFTVSTNQDTQTLVAAFAPPTGGGGGGGSDDQNPSYIVRPPVNRTSRAKAIFTGLSMQFDNQDPYAPTVSTDDQNTTQVLRMRGQVRPKMSRALYSMFVNSYIDSYVPVLLDPLMIDSQALRMRGLVKRYSPLSTRAASSRVTNDSTNAAPVAPPDTKTNWMPEALGHIWHRK